LPRLVAAAISHFAMDENRSPRDGLMFKAAALPKHAAHKAVRRTRSGSFRHCAFSQFRYIRPDRIRRFSMPASAGAVAARGISRMAMIA